MASAAGRMLSPCSAATAPGSASTIAFTGSRQPMTPVDEGSTSFAPTPRSRAAAPATSSAAATPSGAQTFEILLFTTQAASRGSARRARPTITGAPGKAFRVNFAANDGVGSSAAMTTRFIRAGLGTSTGTNSSRVRPDAESEREAGLGLEPGAVLLAAPEGQLGARHGAPSKPRRGVTSTAHLPG